jgi:hypothetical protein
MLRRASIPTARGRDQLQLGLADSASGDDSNDLAAEVSPAAVPQLDLGRGVVVPDPEGPDSRDNTTGVAGRMALDSIRAVEQFAPAELDGVKTPGALAGCPSGGLESAATKASSPHPRAAPAPRGAHGGG